MGQRSRRSCEALGGPSDDVFDPAGQEGDEYARGRESRTRLYEGKRVVDSVDALIGYGLASDA
jgi:hypothetical protein